MHIKNTSKYPTFAVKGLVEFGMNHLDFDHSKLVVVVKNCTKAALRGTAYGSVPTISPFFGKGYNWLVTIGIGDNKFYPETNLRTTRQRKYLTGWVDSAPDGGPISTGCATPWGGVYAYNDVRWLVRCYFSGGKIKSEYRFYKDVLVRGPYGGKKSPLYTCNNWEEGLVATAAHEGQHIVQFSNARKLFPQKVAKAEWECETVASMAVDDYRSFLLAQGEIAA